MERFEQTISSGVLIERALFSAGRRLSVEDREPPLCQVTHGARIDALQADSRLARAVLAHQRGDLPRPDLCRLIQQRPARHVGDRRRNANLVDRWIVPFQVLATRELEQDDRPFQGHEHVAGRDCAGRRASCSARRSRSAHCAGRSAPVPRIRTAPSPRAGRASRPSRRAVSSGAGGNSLTGSLRGVLVPVGNGDHGLDLAQLFERDMAGKSRDGRRWF